MIGVRKNGPAYRSGLRDLDVVTHVRGEPVKRVDELVVQVKAHFEEGIPVTVVRGARGTAMDLLLKPEVMQPRVFRPLQ